MSQERSDQFNLAKDALEKIKEKLTELLASDFSTIHVSHEWSWVPYLKDHVNFLIEQTDGLIENLQDSPPTSSSRIDQE